MGDILHALPAVTALRLAHPDWHIGWVVEPRWQALLRAEIRDQGSGVREREAEVREQGSGIRKDRCRNAAMPVVDRLHFASSREWKRHPLSLKTAREIGALRSELRAANYDAVLDLQGAIRSAVIARMSGCPRRIGEARRANGPLNGSSPSAWLRTART